MLDRPRELYRHRELLASLVSRDLKARYRGTVFGFLWSLGNPLLTTLVLTLVFAVFMRGNTIPNFTAFALIGMLAWNWLSACITGGITSITANSPLISKTYFPREILPLAVVLSNGVNFMFALPAVAVLLLISGIGLGPSLVLLPLVILIQIVLCSGLALLFAVANVFFRDTGVIMESLMLAWFFLTPIFYRPQDLFPQYERLLYWINPAASLIAMYRDVLYSAGTPDALFVLRAALQAVALLAVGWVVFSRLADRFLEEL